MGILPWHHIKGGLGILILSAKNPFKATLQQLLASTFSHVKESVFIIPDMSEWHKLSMQINQPDNDPFKETVSWSSKFQET